MSTEEQALVIGRIASQHAEKRKLLALTRQEMEDIGRVMSSVGFYLQHGYGQDARSSAEDHRAKLATNIAIKYLHIGELSRLIDQFTSLKDEVEAGDRKIKELGITG